MKILFPMPNPKPSNLPGHRSPEQNITLFAATVQGIGALDLEFGGRGLGVLSPHYPRKKKGSFLHKYEEPHTPKSIKDP